MKNKGHSPKLTDSVLKVETCTTCKAKRNRGKKWATECPGAAQAAAKEKQKEKQEA